MLTLELTYASVIGGIATCFAIYKAVCWVLDRYNIGNRRKEARVLKEATRNMMREIIRNAHHDFTSLGYIPEGELEHVEKVYTTYHELKGNGTADRWIDELRNLPREKEVN